MFALTNKPEMGARLYAEVVRRATDPERGIDSMTLILHLSGILVETCFVFEDPYETMETLLRKLADQLQCKPLCGTLPPCTLPPANTIDLETERGRALARSFFEEWLDCEFEFVELITDLTHNLIVSWEQHGFRREETLRLLVECTKKCMAFEVSAQELCDVVIENKVAHEGWGLADCIAALSAVAGRRLALSLHMDAEHFLKAYDLPQSLDHVVFVMTQEAARLGVPVGSDWRFGLPANDVPVSAPDDLIMGIEPYCHSFFATIALFDRYEQAVSCAKAAGRMIAVAAGGEEPEMQPVIAKPLAMAAITDTYKSVCIQQMQVSL